MSVSTQLPLNPGPIAAPDPTLIGSTRGTSPASRRWGFWIAGLGVLLSVVIIGELVYTFALGNLRVVVPGRIYRSAQPNRQRLDAFVKQYDIKTVFNLRGCCEPTPWYLEEASAARLADVNLEDFSFSAGRWPSTRVLQRLVQAIDGAQEPILVHCHQGIDRTGMVAVLWLLLKTNTPLEDALGQLSLRYVHLPWGRTGNLDRFLEAYQDWLGSQGVEHTPDRLRDWVAHHYQPGVGAAELSWQNPDQLSLKPGKPGMVGVVCVNRSPSPWVFKPGTNAGIHLYWHILTPQRKIVYSGVSGLFEKTIAPGETIRLEIPVPGTLPPGDYLVRADLNEPWHARFVQLTGSILEGTLRIQPTNLPATAANPRSTGDSLR